MRSVERVKRRSLLSLFAVSVLITITTFSAFLPSCTSGHQQSASTRWGEIVQHGVAQTPIVIGKYRGDTRMVGTPMQVAVERSLVELERTSCGLVKLKVVWDLDVANGMVQATLRGNSIVMSITEEDAIAAFDKKEGAVLLGYTLWGNVHNVYLVTEKLEDPELALWVSMHEFSHAIGMDHVQLGLMEEEAPGYFFGYTPKWERDDLREFCKVWDCNIEMFDDCRNRY